MTLPIPSPRRLAATVVVAAAASAAVFAGPASAQTTIVIGHQTDGLQTLLKLSGALKGATYKISWTSFASGPPIVEALSSSKIDLGDVGNAPVIFGAANKPGKLKLVAALPQGNNQGDFLVLPASSTITAPAQLKGKKIAYTQGSSGHAFLVQLLDRAGLKQSDVTLVNLQPGDALTAFNSGQVDAWAIWEPFVTIAQTLKPGTKVLPTAKNYAASGLSWVAASSKAAGNPAKVAAIKDYLQRLKKALKWGSAHPVEWGTAFAKETGLPKTLAGTAVKRTEFTLQPVNSKWIGREQTLADILVKDGVITSKVKISALADNLAGS